MYQSAMTILVLMLAMTACSSDSIKKVELAAKPTTYAGKQDSRDTIGLVTGFYYVADSGVGVLLGIDQSAEEHWLNQTPILTAERFQRVALYESNFNDTGWVLSIQLDSSGTEAWRRATSEYVDRRIGFVVNGQLLCAPTVATEIPSGRFELVGYSLPDLQRFKAAIDKEGRR